MPDDYAGGHHFQVGSAAEEIADQMARFQKQQAEQARLRSDYGAQPMVASAIPPPPGPLSPLAGAIETLGAALNEHALLLTRLYDRLDQGGVLLPSPPANDITDTPGMAFRVGQILHDYSCSVGRMNTALRMLLEQLAL